MSTIYQMLKDILEDAQDTALNVLGIKHRLGNIETGVQRIQTTTEEILNDTSERLDQIRTEQLAQSALLQRILNEILPAPPAKFVITLYNPSSSQSVTNPTQEGAPPQMANKMKANLDFQMKDDGSAVASITAVLDKVGNPTSLPTGSDAIIPAWTASDPAVTVTAAADGMSATVTPTQPTDGTPPALVTGVTITAQATLGDGTQVVGVSDPIDVVADAAVGFKISLQ